jgi:hypothetical protein
MIDSITAWLFFTVVFALLPLVADRLRGNTATWEDFWGDGQVLLISAALGAESLGESVLAIKSVQNFPVILLAANFVVVACSTLTYSDCCDRQRRDNFLIPTDAMSLVLFLSALTMSIISKVIALRGNIAA